MSRPIWVTAGVVAGLLLLGAVAYAGLYRLQREGMQGALAEQGRVLEDRFRRLVDRFAEEELSAEGVGLAAFARRMMLIGDVLPEVLDLVVLDPQGRIVKSFSRRGAARIPCLDALPLDRPTAREHPAGSLDASPVGCLSFPIRAGGRRAGTVFFHIRRDWRAGGERAAAWVRRMALRLAPVCAGFYLALGLLLVLGSATADRWRRKAEAASRMEALAAMATGLNHEIKNPLNTIGLSLQYLRRRHEADGEVREVIETAARETDRVARTVGAFSRLARLSRPRLREVELGAYLREALEGAPVAVEIDGEVRARVDPEQLAAAFRDILELLASAPRPGPVRVRLHGSGREWRFATEGSAAAAGGGPVARLFDPFLRQGRGGVGRGLALARAALQAHGGWLEAAVRGPALVLRGGAPRHPPESEDAEDRS